MRYVHHPSFFRLRKLIAVDADGAGVPTVHSVIDVGLSSVREFAATTGVPSREHVSIEARPLRDETSR